MTNQMTKWGVGPKFFLYSATYGVLMVVLGKYFGPLFSITFIPYSVLAGIGIILIILGIPFYLFSIVPVMRAFKAGQLVTSGVYGMCRHPVYEVWVVFIVPGITLLLNSWAALSAPFVMYFFLRALVKKEDIYLEKTFGQEYVAYKQKVPAILPYGWLKKAK
jgi:protein-S-isoprenylcysteine O-methyltransferase Ste14